MIKVAGIGLHSGERSTVRIHPAEGAVRFRVGQEDFRPLASTVVDTTRCTVLGFESGRLATVEHLLAALFIRGIWQGVLLEVSGPEVPILDGSAKEWLAALEGFPSQAPKAVPLPQALEITQDRSSVKASPAAGFSLTATIAFSHPKIAYQHLACPPLGLADLAPARTFGFLNEVEAMRAKGLIQGATLENALVFSQSDFVNPPRFLDEPVRHKALDFLGDLYLVGQPVQGSFAVHRGSHRLHVELARQIQTQLANA